MDFTSTTLPF